MSAERRTPRAAVVVGSVCGQHARGPKQERGKNRERKEPGPNTNHEHPPRVGTRPNLGARVGRHGLGRIGSGCALHAPCGDLRLVATNGAGR
eukprot:scaffold29074_cov109-Isochrysis_galbana.AAC.3